MANVREALIKDASKLKSILGIDRAFIVEDFLRENKCLIDINYNSLVTYSRFGSSSVVIKFYGDVTDIFINDVLEFLFFDKDFYKVNIVVSIDDLNLEEALLRNGFIQEAILHNEVERNGTFEDAGLFYILAPMFTRYNVGFIPFQRGVIAVSGGSDYIDEVSFLSYGKPIENKFIRLCADYSGLMANSMLHSRGDESYEYYSVDGLPAEVIRAITQIREYLKKERFNFDISVKLPESSSFRLDVWNELKKIPFGDTRSYEEIALVLSNNDKTKARKLTRAVGHACSENPVPIIIPCHRVIGKDGKLVGFKDGVEFKDFLLTHELFAALPLC
ncbi:MAG: methylated-DNA--[protein]-cysteine S-methyltransferase [Saccharofermentans sp.]|nr:methylated-DNA--[protein]-cysteine S-methyltransferase [Saccharofermentans sp.]